MKPLMLMLGLAATPAAFLLPSAAAPPFLGDSPPTLDIPYEFESGTRALASEVNDNFSAVESYAFTTSDLIGRIQDNLDLLPQSDFLMQVGLDAGQFTSVSTALDRAGELANESARRVVVQVLPGIFGESAGLVVPRNVTLLGAGPESTVINVIGTVSMLLEDQARVVGLSVETTATDSNNVGIQVLTNTSGTVEDVCVRPPSVPVGSVYVAFEANGGSLTVRRSEHEPGISLHSGISARALLGGTLVLEDSRIVGKQDAVSSSSSTLVVEDSSILAGTTGYAIVGVGSGTSITVEGSDVDGSTGFGALEVFGGFTGDFNVAMSQLNGFVNPLTNLVHCYDEDFQPLTDG